MAELVLDDLALGGAGLGDGGLGGLALLLGEADGLSLGFVLEELLLPLELHLVDVLLSEVTHLLLVVPPQESEALLGLTRVGGGGGIPAAQEIGRPGELVRLRPVTRRRRRRR